MAQNPKKPRKKRVVAEYPALFTAARTPLAPREECAVFGCRRSDRDPDTRFHPFPEDPERWSEWLKLINRQDLSEKLRLGTCTARVCAAHFAPHTAPHTPSLLLPKRSQVAYAPAGPSEMAMEIKLEPVKTEPDDDEDAMIEIRFEPEAPPTYTYRESTRPTTHAILHEPTRPSTQPIILASLLAKQQREINQPKLNPTGPVLEIDSGVLINRPSVKREPTPCFGFQANAAVQTDRKEALDRLATFSVIEKIDIPPTVTDHQYDDVLNRSVHAQTTPELVEYFTAGVKKKLEEELEEANRKLQLAETMPMEKNKFIKSCDQYLDEKIANFVKSHAYLSDKFVGKKYPPQFKSFALNLYLLNPQSYKFVEQFFDLPSKRTMQRFHVPARSGINHELIASLKVKIDQMFLKGKMCAVSFDVMRLSRNLYYDVSNDYLCGMQEIDEVIGPEPANYAALIMVRGLYTRWKQPVSFALLSEKRRYPELKAWVHKIIAKLFDIGLVVKAFVTNPDDEFLDFSVNESAPYFEVDGRKIYHIYDVPYLFKCARDTLMQYDIHIEDGVAKWDDVLNVYESDKQQELRLMPNITDEHVRPSPKETEDVKLATQVLSNTVAAAMHFHVVAKFQPKRSRGTVQFITRMSNLYEILCSRTLENAYRATSAQQRFLKETLGWLRALEATDSDGNIIDTKFVSGLIVTIKSVMLLKADLKKSNVLYLLTKNLNQDCTRAHFKEVERLERTERPTPIMFTRAFRRLFLVNLLNNTKLGAGEDDLMNTLSKIGEYVKADLEITEEAPRNNSLAVGVTDYKISWPSNEYIAGYLLWKCLERHSCKQLIDNLCDYYNFEKQNDADLLLHTFQCYNSDNINRLYLTKPPKALVDFVYHMESKYDVYMTKTVKQNADFGRNIYTAMENELFEKPCQCFPLKFLKMLYIRLRIYNSVKKYNKMLKLTGQKGQKMQ